jgi:hypothetical protein
MLAVGMKRGDTGAVGSWKVSDCRNPLLCSAWGTKADAYLVSLCLAVVPIAF